MLDFEAVNKNSNYLSFSTSTLFSCNKKKASVVEGKIQRGKQGQGKIMTDGGKK